MEALDMQEAQRAYQANLSVIETAARINSNALTILTRK